MEIGEKLKKARLDQGMTQENLAEQLGVSRQTISNWENNRSFPDIVSILKLSDIYTISLDELLKGDDKVMKHLEESTNAVKSRQKFSKVILTVTYLIIWTASIAVFWFGGRIDAMGYSLVYFYLVLPVTTFIISVFIGRDNSWAGLRWVMLLFFGFMYMLAPYATFSLANMTSVNVVRFPHLSDMLPGILCAAAGIAAGSVVRFISERRIQVDSSENS